MMKNRNVDDAITYANRMNCALKDVGQSIVGEVTSEWLMNRKGAEMIQINMDMPDDCSVCKFWDLDGFDCLLNPESNEYMTFEEQYKHCPLIEVKDGEDK